ncbi:hypothetical protein REPUB_Repub18cG0060900 [Reevesia pubescens]
MKGWFYNAEKINHSGLKLKKKSSNLLDIELRRSVLEVPTLFIGNSTKLVLRNLLAYEQCNSYAAPYFTSLVLLFSSLINTRKDVELLRGAGIIKEGQRSDEEVVALFSSLYKDLDFDLDDCCIAKQIEDINRRCQTYWAIFLTFSISVYNRIDFVSMFASYLVFMLSFGWFN